MSTFASSITATVCKITFTGRNGAGPISITGLAVGDVPVAGTINGANAWPSFSESFEPIISTNNQIQQTDLNDFSSLNFVVYLLRGVL